MKIVNQIVLKQFSIPFPIYILMLENEDTGEKTCKIGVGSEEITMKNGAIFPMDFALAVFDHLNNGQIERITNNAYSVDIERTRLGGFRGEAG